VAYLAWIAASDVRLPTVPYEFTVHPGAGLKSVGRQLAADGVLPEGESLWILGRITGKAQRIQAGTYRLEAPVSALDIIDKLARGDGSHEFTRTLEEHNRAVAKYQLGR
jgi:UPF0755 protein